MPAPISIQFSVRSAEGLNLPWAPGPCVASLGAAFDELAAWPAPPGPQIVRVRPLAGRVEGVTGDWWVEPKQSAPRAIVSPRWGGSVDAMRWAKAHSPVEAWETCPNAVWMADTLAFLPTALLLPVVRRVATALLPLIPPEEPRPARALDALQSWERDPPNRLGLKQSHDELAGAWSEVPRGNASLANALIAFETMPSIFGGWSLEAIPASSTYFLEAFLGAAADAQSAAAWPTLERDAFACQETERAFLAEVAGWMRETIPLAAWLRSHTVP